MASTAAPNSAGGQWFITTGPNSANLDATGTYVVFGNVTEGLDIARRSSPWPGPDGETLTETVDVETVEITES